MLKSTRNFGTFFLVCIKKIHRMFCLEEMVEEILVRRL